MKFCMKEFGRKNVNPRPDSRMCCSFAACPFMAVGRRVIDTDGRKFHNVTNTGPFRGIDKRIHYFQLIWQQRRQKENFLDAFERLGKCFLVFKVEGHECNVCAELFSRFGLIANARAHRYALSGKLLRDIAPDCASSASYQNRFAHKFPLYSVTRSRKKMENKDEVME